MRTTQSIGAGPNGEGGFWIKPLDAGAYDVEASGRRWMPVTIRSVAAGTHDLRITLTPAGRASGRVVDAATGDPLRDFTVDGERFESSDGRFEYQGIRDQSNTIRFRATGFGTETRGPFTDVSSSVATDLGTVRLQREARIRGRLVDSSGRPVSAGHVRARPMGSAFSDRETSARCDANGAFELDRLSPDRWCVEPAAAGSASECPSGRVVETRAGEVVEDVVISAAR